jgi:hypothetical protein
MIRGGGVCGRKDGHPGRHLRDDAVMRHRSSVAAWQTANPERNLGYLAARHGMSRSDYDAFLTQGCAIEGCLKPAAHIDHNHAICPQPRHSCDKCRRGPLCHGHNTGTIAIIDTLVSGGLLAELAYLNLSVTFRSLSTSNTEDA